MVKLNDLMKEIFARDSHAKFLLEKVITVTNEFLDTCTQSGNELR
jgi:hypothetical protein